MTDVTSTDSRFWDRVAPKYSQQPVPDPEAYQLTLERVEQRLTRDARVLELGCGTGTTALRLAHAAGYILATDVSPAMIRIAQSKADASAARTVRFEVATLDSARLDNERFDVIMAFNLLHLLPDIDACLARVRQLLNPGGLFISKTPCLGERGAVIRIMIPILQAFGRAPYVNFIKKAPLQAAISGGGFELVESGLYPAKSHSLYIVGKLR